MKKLLIVFGLSLMLVGCSFSSLFSKEDTKKTPTPSRKIVNQIKEYNFYFNAGETGLTLLNTDDDNFSIQLSNKIIGEADIVDGILTFTEILDEGENIKVVNLKAYADMLSKKK
jgi:hypothetical protein